MRAEVFDVAIIGGGINGAAAARDAAMRGLRVALVERGDFAGATSSRSSKLIHGGFRYLPQGQLRLVYSALRERERLRYVTAPHLVAPIRFLFPVYRGRGVGRFAMAIGLTLYDRFAGTARAEWHRSLNAAEVCEREPALAREGLTGGALYFDAWADDARLTFENVLDAALHGCAVANYVAVEGFSKSNGRIRAAALRDSIGGAAIELRARVFVNATGPWVDDIRRLDDRTATPCVRLTKGAHLVIPLKALPVRESIVLSDGAGRIVFVMPHDRYVLVGTTDTDYAGDPGAVGADAADVAYLLSVLAASLPGIKLSHRNIASSFAGLRALVCDGGDSQAPSAVSREEVIIASPSGLLTVAGGKLTTHREIAGKLVAHVMKDLGRPAGPCPTLAEPLPGARPSLTGGPREGADLALDALPPAAREILVGRYGSRAGVPAAIAMDRRELAEPLAPQCPVIGAEVIHAVRSEMATSIADFLVRRTGLVWRCPPEAEAAAGAVARLMGEELGWDRARIERELGEFSAQMRRQREPA